MPAKKRTKVKAGDVSEASAVAASPSSSPSLSSSHAEGLPPDSVDAMAIRDQEEKKEEEEQEEEVEIVNSSLPFNTMMLQGHLSTVYSLAFNQQGTAMVSAGFDKNVLLW